YAGRDSESDVRPIIHQRSKFGRSSDGRCLSYGMHRELNLATPDDIVGFSRTGNSSIGLGFFRSFPVPHQTYLSLTMGAVSGEWWNAFAYVFTWTFHPESAVTFGINTQCGPFATFLVQY